MQAVTAADLIEQHRLEPHPEGGWYRETYRADQEVGSPVTGTVRSAFTHIYFLLEREQVSRFHKVLHGEIWNFYAGDPLRLITFDKDPNQATVTRLGGGGAAVSYASIVEPGHYQAAESEGEFSLVGCSVAPGFDFADFSFLQDGEAALAAAVPDNFSKFV